MECLRSRLIWHGVPSILEPRPCKVNCQTLRLMHVKYLIQILIHVVNVSLFPRPSSPQGFDHLKTGDEEGLGTIEAKFMSIDCFVLQDGNQLSMPSKKES